MRRIGVVGNPGSWSSEHLTDVVEARTGFRCLIDLEHAWLDAERKTVHFFDLDLSELDAIIVKKLGDSYAPAHLDRLELLRLVAERGVPMLSDPRRILRVLDRLTCTVTMLVHDVPMPPTVVTEDVGEALAAVRRFERVVLKPLFSSKARGMHIVDADQGDARARLERFQAAGNPVLYIQQVVDLPDRDLGVAFLAGEYLATYARVRSGGAWNTSTRSGGVYEPHEPSAEIIELARRAQEPFGLDFTCVDVAECASGPVVFEVSAFGGFRGLLEACNIDAAERCVDLVMQRLER
jgi:ribosomal protein S6--L-glutamate ligase